MSTITTIPYQGPQPPQLPMNCPLCQKRPTKKKTLYGHRVCKKCYYAFANRRQVAYLVDGLIVLVPNIAIILMAVNVLQRTSFNQLEVQGILLLIDLPLSCLFVMKDGFNGQSPGRRLTGVQVLDDRSNQPIEFRQSFKRNSVLLGGLIPVIGGLVSLIVWIIIVVQMGKGYRIGDHFAQTRVIWKKYASSPVFGGSALVCEVCGYALVGNTSGICPECGTPVSPRNLSRLAINPPAVGATP